MKPSTASRAPDGRLRLVLGAAALGTLALLLLHAWVYRFLTDDAFISFRYARNLADGLGLVFNPGLERVEGYTNFLWVLVLAAFEAVGLAPERVASGLSIALTVVLWGLVLRRAADDPASGEPAWVRLVPCLLLAATRSVAMWSTSGLETRLFEVLIVAGVFRLQREIEEDRAGGSTRSWVSGAWFGAASLTRPDGALVAVSCLAVASALLARARPAPLKSLLSRVAAFALPIGAHLAFRISYYGDWVPNTYHAKVGGRTWWEMGLVYVGGFVLEYGLVLLAPLVVLGVLRAIRRDRVHVAALWAATVVPHAVYVVAIGGDHFEYRPLDLYFPFLYLGALDGIRFLIERGRSRAVPIAWTALLLVAVSWIPTKAHLEFPRDRFRPTFPGGDTDDAATERFLEPGRDPLLRWPGLRAVARAHRDLVRRMTANAVGVRQEDHRKFFEAVVPEGRRLREAIEKGRIPRTMTIALSSVGVVPYLSDLPTIDRLGLTDATVAVAPIVAPERAMAHEKRDTWDYVRRRGVVVSSIRAAHILFALDDPTLPTSLSGAFRGDVNPAFAVVDDRTLLVGRLPQGLDTTRRLVPTLDFKSLDDPEGVAEMTALTAPALRARLERAPEDNDARIALGQTLLLAGRAREALEILEAAVDAAPDRVSAWMGLAGARAGSGDVEGARAALGRALELARRRGAASIVRDLEASEKLLSGAR